MLKHVPHEENEKRPLGQGRLNRRQALLAGGGLMGLGLSAWLDSNRAGAGEPAGQPAGLGGINPEARARSVILVWLSGGPSQLDTFDPKPGIGVAFLGRYTRDLATNVEGIHIALPFPRLAQHADKYALIRTMTHGDFSHESASYKMLTGTPGRGDLSYPLVGCVIAEKKFESGYKGALRPFMVLGRPFTRVGGAGFLGRRCEAFVVANPSALPVADQRRIQDRRSLLQSLDTLNDSGDAVYQDIDASRQAAYGQVLGQERRVFDLTEEPQAMHTLYGTHNLGQRCLLARRLVQHGVAFVAVNHGGWDTHSRHFEQMDNVLAPALDKALSGLLADLHERDLLKTTVVVCVGEFGRTPRVQTEAPWFGGRGHFGTCFSALVAGGSFHGGRVVGVSNRTASAVLERPVYPWDLWGSVYQLMGIEPHSLLPHPEGRAVRVTPADVPRRGGLLTEIM